MIQPPPNLIALLQSDQFLMADLFVITLQSGVVLRYTSLDIDLTVDGHAYSCAIPISRGGISVKAGIDVDELSITFFPTSADMVGGFPFVTAAARGLFDGAEFTMYRAFFSTWQSYAGKIIRFVGRVSDLQDFDRTAVPMTIKSTLELLNTKMPRNVYQAGCSHVLFDSGCGLTKASHGVAGTVQAGSTTTNIICGFTQAAAASGTLTGYSMGVGDGSTTSFAQAIAVTPSAVTAVHVAGTLVSAGRWSYQLVGPQLIVMLLSAPKSGASVTAEVTYQQAGYFDLGTVTFTSGQNTGSSRTVKAAGPGYVTFALPLPAAPSTGDTFTAYPGCDKLQATCTAKFNNLSRFNGCPYIPAAETAY